jgi:hypothetical protein
MAATQNQLTAEFAAVLGCKEKFVQTRLIALGHETVCGRCGGGGHYSYCQMYGTTCFGCGGRGKVATKLTSKLLATVKTQVAAGELAPYLERIKAESARKALVNGYIDNLFATWKALPTVAADKGKHFTDCSERHNSINQYVSKLYDEARELVTAVEKNSDNADAALARLAEIKTLVANAESCPDYVFCKIQNRYVTI